MSSAPIRIVILLLSAITLGSCHTFHISKKRYSDGFYVDYSQSEKQKKKEYSSRKKRKEKEDSTTIASVHTESIVDSSSKTDTIAKTIITKPEKEVVLYDTIVKSKILENFCKSRGMDPLEYEEIAIKENEDLLLFILCILIPPYAVFLKYGSKSNKLKTVIVLTLLGFIPGIFYAFFMVSADD